MENKKRLIDANAVEAKIEKSFKKLIANQSRPELAAALSYVGDLIIEAPTVDAVEVVRCKDCEFCVYNSSNDTYKCRSMNGMYRTVNPDDFCSYGERR